MAVQLSATAGPSTAADTNDGQKLLSKELGKQEEASKRDARYRQKRQTNLDASHQQLQKNQSERNELDQNVSHSTNWKQAKK